MGEKREGEETCSCRPAKEGKKEGRKIGSEKGEGRRVSRTDGEHTESMLIK